MKPDAAFHKPDPAYLRSLLEEAGLTQGAAARAVGVSARRMRYYLSIDPRSHQPAPYAVQFALEALAQSVPGDRETDMNAARMIAAIIRSAGGTVRLNREKLRDITDFRVVRIDTSQGDIVWRVEPERRRQGAR